MNILTESYLHPSETIIDSSIPDKLNIDINHLRGRSYKFPNKDDKYIDTTSYDDIDQALDLGFQRLRKIETKLYPILYKIKILYIDHNCISTLPLPSEIPELEYLSCKYNRLTHVPFYPKLRHLNVSNNMIKNLDEYSGSKLCYLDCSFNTNIKIPPTLNYCSDLYVTNSNLNLLDLKNYQKLKNIDCSDNKITNIVGSLNDLLEINLDNNLMTSVPIWNTVYYLSISNNKLISIELYPMATYINISSNMITSLGDQPNVETLIANDNQIEIVGIFPKVKLIELKHNKINTFQLPCKIEMLNIEFNPINVLDIHNITNMKCISMNVHTYHYIYDNYYDMIDSINISPDTVKLKYYLEKSNMFTEEDMVTKVQQILCETEYRDIFIAISKITLKIYYSYFKIKKNQTIVDIFNDIKFISIQEKIRNIYKKSAVVNIYFNGYRD